MKVSNLKIPGIDKNLFNHPFYLNRCRKIDFNGVIRETEIIGENSTDYISLAPKFKPHSDYEMMLQSTDSVVKSPITSLADETISYIFGTGLDFIKFYSKPENVLNFSMDGGYAYLAFNYDEMTTDRHSGMSKKPFHLHLNSWKMPTLSRLNEVDKNSVSPYYYESIVDPIFDLNRALVYDALDCDELNKYLERSNPICGGEEISYSGIYKLKGGWEFLESEEFPKMMKLIHERLEERYKDILECFCGTREIPELYTRHILLSDKSIMNNIISSSMPDSTKAALIKMMDRVHSITPEEFTKLSENTDIRDSYIPLRWLAYSIGFFSNEYISCDRSLVDEDCYMNCTPRLYTKIGGASILNMPENAIVKIDRGSGDISKDEFDGRVEMHKAFVKTTNRGIR